MPATASADQSLYNPNEIIYCGDREVVIADIRQLCGDPNSRVWSWTAADSPQIAPEHRDWFRAMDECKPAMNGQFLLLSSSASGGIAVIRRSDKQCLFYAGGANAHSLELIPPNLIAGAFSISCDELRLYTFDPATPADGPATAGWSMSLSHGHGAVWYPAGQTLWTLSNTELIALKIHPSPTPSAEVINRVRMPGPGGHDLFPFDGQSLVVTNNSHVFRFDPATGKLVRLAELGNTSDVKSVSRNPVTGQIIYTQGQNGHWWSHQIQQIDGPPIQLPPLNMYKARWNTPSPLADGNQ